jgi:enoyl-CoA hydratase
VADLGSLQRLPRIIGEGATRELAFTGDDIDVERARALGLVNHVFGSRTDLEAGAMAMARRIAENPPLTVQGIKRVMNYGDGKPVREALAHTAVWNAAFLQSGDLTEALTAFAERRAPRVRGE